jgi:hypothetical protein
MFLRQCLTNGKCWKFSVTLFEQKNWVFKILSNLKVTLSVIEAIFFLSQHCVSLTKCLPLSILPIDSEISSTLEIKTNVPSLIWYTVRKEAWKGSSVKRVASDPRLPVCFYGNLVHWQGLATFGTQKEQPRGSVCVEVRAELRESTPSGSKCSISIDWIIPDSICCE